MSTPTLAAGGLTDWVTSTVTTGGPFAVFAVMLIENLFPPIPSEAVLPLSGFLVQQGTLPLAPVFVAATAGSVVGALLLYAIGRWGGRPVLLRWGRVLRLDEPQLDRADHWFDTHGRKLVFWFRMVPIARSVISVPAGASEMPIGQFLLLTTLGSALWNAALIGAGALVGDNWRTVSEIVSTYSYVVLALVIVFSVVAFAVWRRRVNAKR